MDQVVGLAGVVLQVIELRIADGVVAVLPLLGPNEPLEMSLTLFAPCGAIALGEDRAVQVFFVLDKRSQAAACDARRRGKSEIVQDRR